MLKRKEKEHFLRQFPLFKQLDDYEMVPLIDLMETKTYPKDSFVFMKNEPITHVYFILKGEVKIFRTNVEGREQIINILKAPDMFPHQGLFRQGNYPANAQIAKPTQLLTISIADFEQFLILYPSVSMKMFRILGEIIVDLQNRLEEKILLTAYEQIVMLILRLTKKYGHLINDEEYKITLQFTHQDLANMIGSSRETISRNLTELRHKGLIKNDAKGYVIVKFFDLKNEVVR